MKPCLLLLKSVRVPTPVAIKLPFQPPALSSISVAELPNNTFEQNNLYYIKKTAYGHWPVYKKIQNTRISTEIKRVQGDVSVFAEELLSLLQNDAIKKDHVRVNTKTGEVNIKGDYTEQIKSILDTYVKL